jgi:anti-sigma factor ChrR (cupin superfamily)
MLNLVEWIWRTSGRVEGAVDVTDPKREAMLEKRVEGTALQRIL